MKKTLYTFRPFPTWATAYPDKRNELLTDARALVGTALRADDNPVTLNIAWAKAARKFMKESRP